MENNIEKGGVGSGKYIRKKHDFTVNRDLGIVEFKINGEVKKLSASGFIKFIKDFELKNYFSSISFNTLNGLKTYILDIKTNTFTVGKIKGKDWIKSEPPDMRDLAIANIKPTIDNPFQKIQFNLDKLDTKMKQKQKEEIEEIQNEDIEKAINPNKTWKWIDKVSKNGTKYRQKYNVSVKELKDQTQPFVEREAEWKRSVNNSSLKDKLNYSIKVKDNYYDNEGKQIHVPERFKDVVDKLYNPKQNVRSLIDKYGGDSVKSEKEYTNELNDKIEKNDKILNIGLEDDVKKHNELNNSNIIRNQIKDVLFKVNKETKIDSVITALEIVRSKVNEDINPIIHFSYRDKPSAADLEDLILRLKTFKSDEKNKDFSMSDLKISNVEDFDDSDFNVKNHKIKDQKHLNDLYEKGNKLQAKEMVKSKNKVDKETDPDNWGGEKKFKTLIEKQEIGNLKTLLINLKKQKFDNDRDKSVSNRQVKIILEEIKNKKNK